MSCHRYIVAFVTLGCCLGLIQPPGVVQGSQARRGDPERPAEFLNEDGLRFVLLELPEEPGGEVVIGGRRYTAEELIQREPKSAEAMSEAELAEALRAVTFRYGRWYVSAEPNYLAARRAIELRGKTLLGADAYNPHGLAEIAFGKQCCGIDDRVAANSNSYYQSWQWPWATVLSTMRPINPSNADWRGNYTNRDCTWQMIGPSTALAVAHCFKPPKKPGQFPLYGPSLTPLLRWGAAADGEGLNANGLTDAFRPIPPGWPESPNGVGGFTPYFTLQWLITQDLLEWDFAVIDFRGHANPTPGSTSGWQGWGVYPAFLILSKGILHVDVPQAGFNGAQYHDRLWPRILWIPNYRSVSSVGSYWIDYDGDCSAGSSGSALWQYWSGWRVIGVTSRYTQNAAAGLQCAARRLDATYASFIEAHSEY